MTVHRQHVKHVKIEIIFTGIATTLAVCFSKFIGQEDSQLTRAKSWDMVMRYTETVVEFFYLNKPEFRIREEMLLLWEKMVVGLNSH